MIRDARTRSGLVGVVSLLFALAGPAVSHAEGTRRIMFVLQGTPRDQATTELLARIRGELRAARFEVDDLVATRDATPREVVEREARRPGMRAAMGIFLDQPDPEIWVADARSSRTIVEPLVAPGEGERRASVLAAKAVDLLKAVLSEVPPGEPRPPDPSAAPEPPPTLAREPPPVIQASTRDWLLLAGAGWLRPGDAGTVAPFVSVAFLARHLGARASAMGLGSATELTGAAGTARVRQQVALGEVLGCVRPGLGLRACGAAGAGAELLSVTGAGAPGFQGNDSTLWSAVGAVGAGLAWTPRRWVAIGADARAVGAWPSTDLRINGAPAAHLGGVGVWLTAGIGARL